MLIKLQPNLYQLRSFLVSSYLIIDQERICLIDGGFLGSMKLIDECLKNEGLGWESISDVLLTHGHLDHTYNLARIQKRSPAKLYAHPLETDHIAARHTYRGINRVCGLLEFCGRLVFGYKKPRVDHLLKDQEQLEIAGNIRAVHMPGHTAGHCSYLWEKHDLLFAGDMFATGHKRTFLPPPIFNSCTRLLHKSLQSIRDLKPTGILSNHCDLASPEIQAKRFRQRFG